MSASPLQQFYSNETEREAVKEFLLECLKERAVQAVFDKETVSGIYDAKNIINKAFDTLAERYGIVTPPKKVNSR